MGKKTESLTKKRMERHVNDLIIAIADVVSQGEGGRDGRKEDKAKKNTRTQ